MMNVKGMYTTILVLCAVLATNGCGNRTVSVTTTDPDKIAHGPKGNRATRLGVTFTQQTTLNRSIRFRLHFDVKFKGTQPVEGHYFQVPVTLVGTTTGANVAGMVVSEFTKLPVVATSPSQGKVVFNWTTVSGTTSFVHDVSAVEFMESSPSVVGNWKTVAILEPGQSATILGGLRVAVTDEPVTAATSPTKQSHK